MIYSIELDALIEKRLMCKVQIKDPTINKNNDVYKVVNFIDDEALLKKYCHPSLIHNLKSKSLKFNSIFLINKLTIILNKGSIP